MHDLRNRIIWVDHDKWSEIESYILYKQSFWSLAIQTEHLVVKRTKIQHLNAPVKVHHLYLQIISLKRNQMYWHIE